MRNLECENTTWSVQLEATLWSDDTFCGSYDECLHYCRDIDVKINGQEARLALLLLDESDCCVEVLDIIDDIDEIDDEDNEMPKYYS